MVRLISPEAANLPDGLYDAWQDAGPRRVRGEVVARLSSLSDRGILRIAEPTRAALQFILLTTAELEEPHDGPDAVDTATAVRAGVAAFLHGYATRSTEFAPTRPRRRHDDVRPGWNVVSVGDVPSQR